MATVTLTEKLQELILISEMLHAGDSFSLNFAFDLLVEARELMIASQFNQTLIFEVDSVLALNRSDPDQLMIQVADLIRRLSLCELNQEATAEVQNKQDVILSYDYCKTLDLELLAEFIGTHVPQIEDFEAKLILAAQSSGEDAQSEEELTGDLKSYLHNIKGDAGSVGLFGVEKATHVIEESLRTASPIELIEAIQTYFAWVRESLESLKQGKLDSEDSSSLIKRVQAKCNLKSEINTNTENTAQIKVIETDNKISGDSAILEEFNLEVDDHLNALEELLLGNQELEGEIINTIFRSIHSIKGGSSYFNLLEVTKSSHITESLLDKIRKGVQVNQARLRELLLAYVDLQKQLFKVAKQAMAGDGQLKSLEQTQTYYAKVEQLDTGSQNHPKPSTVSTLPAVKSSEDQTVSDSEKDAPRITSEKLELRNFIKVDTNRLDQLIEYIGEMIISSSMLARSCRELLSANDAVINNTHQLEKISRDIQEVGMSMRLIPIKGLLQKMSRLVWDTSRKLGKQIDFKMSGEDTELDRTVIEKIADPLMHMIRNSVDHGIENPEQRASAGKSETGTVEVSAFHSGGNIHIQIRDDGDGINPDRIFRKAVEKGLITEQERLKKEEILMLIFAPGFSTAEKITDISGRGVGMDVVRRNIEALRGRIRIESEVGKGSTFTIELPLTLAIMDGIECILGSDTILIPTLSIVEFVKPTPTMVTSTFAVGQALVYREKVIPIFPLSRLCCVQAKSSNVCDGTLLVVESNNELVALLVDEVVGSYSAVIKNLGPAYADIKGLAGCAVMPNGHVGLIIDVASIVEVARKDTTLFDKEVACKSNTQACGLALH